MKKKHLYILLFFGSISVFGQFDRINTTPIHLHPSFVGSTGTNRIGLQSFYGKGDYSKGFSSTLSYDALVPSLKGGIGVSINYNWYRYTSIISSDTTRISGNFTNFAFAYAPKLTFNKSVTWSPSIAIKYRHSNYYSDQDLYNPLDLSIGLLRNTKKTFYGFEYTHRLSHRNDSYAYTNELAGIFGIKFNKKEQNDVSSTFSSKLGVGRVANTGYIGDESYLQYLIHFQYDFKIKMLLMTVSTARLAIGVKTKNFGIQVSYGSYSEYLSENLGGMNWALNAALKF